ncbi:MAG: xylulokinase, partial [Chloroflexota bacterium]
WQGATRVMREALRAGAIGAEQIVGIGISGLMHAPVLLDGEGTPVVPAPLWMDQRCAPQCETLRREAVAGGLRVERGFSTTQTAPKLRWLAEQRPEVLAQAHQLLLPKDFIRFRLTGVGGTDAADAGGTGMFDRESGEWAWDIVHLTGAPREIIPAIRPAWALAGGVTPQAAAETGLAPGTPVAVGSADTFCTRLGAGGLAPGEVCIYLGTAAWIAVAAGAAPDGRQIVRGFGATSTTGAALRWARDLLASSVTPGMGEVSASYEALTREAGEVPAGAEGLLFLPHLAGERGPQADPLARGALVGLTLRHGRGHVVRAVLEGTVFQIRRLLEARAGGAAGRGTTGESSAAQGGAAQGGAMPTAGLVCGGAARSALWMQVLADVTTLPLRAPAVVEAGTLGASILGGVAAGLFSLEAAQARMVRPARTFVPDAPAAAQYEQLYARYCRLDDLLAPWFREEAG